MTGSMSSLATLLLRFEVVVEGLTALFLLALPGIACAALFGGSEAIGDLATRFVGVALLSLVCGCWLGRQHRGGRPALAAFLVYNLLSAILFLVVGLAGQHVGFLLWPAAGAHALVTLLLAGVLLRPSPT